MNEVELDWRQHIPEDVKGDPSFAPIIEKMTEKDIPTLVKSHLHLVSKQGRMLALPGKDAKPEDKAAFQSKLYDAGVLTRPPDSPDKYEVKIPDGFKINDEAIGKFKSILHKSGAPIGLAGELAELYFGLINGQKQSLKTEYEAGLAELKKEYGVKFDELSQIAGRFAGNVFTPEELKILEDSGIADHPKFLSALMKLAPLAQSDSSYLADKGGAPAGPTAADNARVEHGKMISDKTHPKYKEYWDGDFETKNRLLDEIYNKAYPEAVGKKVEL